jgi:membrane protein
MSGDAADEVESVDTREVDPAEIGELRDELDDLAADLDAKTKNREDLEADLRRYVRWRQRRGHARGWGPYLVLLYGTVMTVGAFYFLSGGWAILAMLVVWLSTLGLYTLMLIVGLASGALGLPGRLAERLRSLR